MASPSAVEHWTMLTPEFPPTSGGVADHVQRLADELVRRGAAVEVWGPAPTSGPVQRAYFRPCRFRGESLAELERALRANPSTRVLVHYVPLTFGRFNPGFMSLLEGCPRPLWIMFHEVAYPLRWRQRLRHRVLGAMTHWTAHKLARRADRVLVSTLSFEPLLRKLTPSLGEVHWLPISSNIPTPDATRTAPRVRNELGLEPDDRLVAHFGTFREGRALLEETVKLLLERERVHVAILGRGAEDFARGLDVPLPLRRRVHGVGLSPAARVAELIAAADLALYPFVDGVTTRRTSLMAALRLGTPVVTTMGAMTEPLWYQGEPVRLVAPEAATLAAVVDALLADDKQRRALAERGKHAYERYFTIEHAVDALRAVAPAGGKP